MTTSPTSAVPAVGRSRAPKLPSCSERVLDNGLRVVAVRRSGVPLVELRLRIPFGARRSSHVPRAHLLAASFLSGTERRDQNDIAETLQAMGGSLSTTVDADRFAVVGSALSNRLPDLLGLLAELLTEPAYPKRDVEGERDRLSQEILIARSQPSVVAGEALLQRLYGDHPYAHDLPQSADVDAVTPAALRSLHARRVVATGATLVLVGDLTPAKALDRAEAALSGWAGGPTSSTLPAVPDVAPGPVHLINRAGAVQTNIRLATTAVPRTSPDFAPLQLANLVFGGYFSSRLVANIREDKGYTYTPHSGIEHAVLASRLVVDADVATAVTAPALLEMRYELGRIATLPVSPEELEGARRYAIGSLALSTASSAGLASTLSVLIGAGLGLDYLREHPLRLEDVTSEEVLAVARRHFAPSRFVSVLLGDADTVHDGVAALDAVEVV